MPRFPETLALEHLLDVHADLEPAQNVGASPLGRRSVHIVTGGTFEGPRLRGSIRPGGGDWFLSLPNGAGDLDVRVTLETHDGALIFLSYRGILDASAEVMRRAMTGDDVDPAEYYFRTTPRFETGSEQYASLNKMICAGTGYFAPGKVGYRVFAVK